jgi:hypothetical protein
MSCTMGPCPACGDETMYDDRDPTLCVKCRPILASLRNYTDEMNARKAAQLGNRKQRRAERSKRGR